MLIRVDGRLPPGVTAKDLVLSIIGRIGTAGGTGHAIEFAGDAMRALSMEGRMTMCNMSIEAGARAGMVAVDERTLDYLQGRPFAPSGETWTRAVAYWRTLVSDPGAKFDTTHVFDAASVQAAGDVGNVAGNGRVDRGPRARSRPRARQRAARRHGARARVHGARRRTCRSPTSASTRCSSARARIRGSRICARRRASCAAATWRAACGSRWSCRDRVS